MCLPLRAFFLQHCRKGTNREVSSSKEHTVSKLLNMSGVWVKVVSNGLEIRLFDENIASCWHRFNTVVRVTEGKIATRNSN